MGLIIGRKDIRAVFEKVWSTSYVPGLLLFGERSKKKAIKDIHATLVESGTCNYK